MTRHPMQILLLIVILALALSSCQFSPISDLLTGSSQKSANQTAVQKSSATKAPYSVNLPHVNAPGPAVNPEDNSALAKSTFSVTLPQVISPGEQGAGLGEEFVAAILTRGGYYLSAVDGGGIQGPGAVVTNAKEIGPNEKFTFKKKGDMYTIAMPKGTFLTAVGGGGKKDDPIHTDGTEARSYEVFKLLPLSDGSYAIQTPNGMYLTAVDGGNIAGRGAVRTDAAQIGENECFKIVIQP